MDDVTTLPSEVGLSEECWKSLPDEARAAFSSLAQTVRALLERIEQLEAPLKANSSNSSKPPSSDPPSMRSPKTPVSVQGVGGRLMQDSVICGKAIVWTKA